MRSMLTLGLAALTALVAGCCCQVVGYQGNPNFSDPFQNDLIGPTIPSFPVALTFPDETMYFFPIFDDRRSSDLVLLGMRCDTDDYGHLYVTARVENLGSSPITPNVFTSGGFGAVRVAAVVTTADGVRERVDGTSMLPLTVAGTIELPLLPTRALASDVVSIDVEADPDRVVPDPLRDNNVLSWQGTMRPNAADCKIER